MFATGVNVAGDPFTDPGDQVYVPPIPAPPAVSATVEPEHALPDVAVIVGAELTVT